MTEYENGQEVMDGPCLSCGKVQELVLCEDCRVKYPFMRDWDFDEIINHFLVRRQHA